MSVTHQMMMYGKLEAFAGSEVISVVVRFGVEQDGEAVGLADLRSGVDVNIFFSEKFSPERKVIQTSIEVKLRLDDGADAHVCAEVRVEVGRGPVFGDPAVAGFKYHRTAGLLGSVA